MALYIDSIFLDDIIPLEISTRLGENENAVILIFDYLSLVMNRHS